MIGTPRLWIVVLLIVLVSVRSEAQSPSDLVFANANQPNRVCLNNGSGFFSCVDVSSDANLTYGVAVADFDGTNGSDMAFANFSQMNRVCLNDGDGTFTCSDLGGDETASIDIATGDFDGLNGPDVIVANELQANELCLNDGSGTFSCSYVDPSSLKFSYGLGVADFDGLSGLDFVIANYSEINQVCLNDGTASFTCSDIGSDAFSSNDIAVSDVDGVDGPDFAVANVKKEDDNQMCLNNGGGSFECYNVIVDNNSSEAVATGDVDGLSGPDLVFATKSWPNYICTNNGSVSFSCSWVTEAFYTSFAVAIASFDGQPGPDIVFANLGQANRLCLNEGSGAFNCVHINDDTFNSSDVAIGDFGSTILSAEITEIKAILDADQLILRWETASESNNSGFEVQHSSALPEPGIGSGWQTLAFVAGAGTTTESHGYRYSVLYPDPGVHRFRLKQIDFDGRVTLSPEVDVTVLLPAGFMLWPAYPNPFSATTRLRLAIGVAQYVEVAVFDILGRRITSLWSGPMQANKVQNLQWAAGTSPSGMYMVVAEGERFRTVRKVAVAR